MPVRPMNLDGGADGQIGQVGQVVGEEAFLDPVHAQLEAGCRWPPRRSSRRGSACLPFASGATAETNWPGA